MKLVFLLVVVAFVVLFFAGLLMPGRSWRLQARFSDLLRRGERKSDGRAGTAGDMTQTGLERARKAGVGSARAGRRLRDKLDR